MITLESTITGETCANHIRSMREPFVPEEDIHHYNCSGLNYSCPNYIPIKQFEVPLNQLRFTQ